MFGSRFAMSTAGAPVLLTLRAGLSTWRVRSKQAGMPEVRMTRACSGDGWDAAGARSRMSRASAMAVLTITLFGSTIAVAEDCYPNCDLWHYYGPYDFTYIRPGLYGYPICGPRGDCSPYLAYTYQGGYRLRKRVTIRTLP